MSPPNLSALDIAGNLPGVVARHRSDRRRKLSQI